MNRFRASFMAGTMAIAVAAFLLLQRPDAPISPAASRLGPGDARLHLTGISENGTLWLNDAETVAADIKTTDFTTGTRLHADERTAWEFLCEGFLFTALPGSAVRYTPQTRELILEKGEFFWQREIPGRKIEASLFRSGNTATLSAAGRLRLNADGIEAWSYAGVLDFNLDGSLFKLEELQYVYGRSGKKSQPFAIFPAPQFIAPEAETIALNRPDDTIVQFKWRNVPGARNYILKLYPSAMRENLLLSRVLTDNAVTLDIMPLIEHGELYWEAAAFDAERRIESAPTRMGVLTISSSLLKKGQRREPPRIEVGSLSVSGEMVLIKGVTDPNAQLLIDGAGVKLDSEGRFIHTISYTSIGIKEIVFRAVAPSGLEAELRKQVTIFEE